MSGDTHQNRCFGLFQVNISKFSLVKIEQKMGKPKKKWHWLRRLPGLGNNNEKLGLPERLSAGIQFRFRNLFHGKISGNRNFIC